MQRHSIILGAAFLATVAVAPVGAQTSTIPNPGAQATVTAEPPDPTPFQRGYERGRAEGYSHGESQAVNYCVRDPYGPTVTASEDAYGVGYKEAYQLSYGRGFEDAAAKYCRPAG